MKVPLCCVIYFLIVRVSQAIEDLSSLLDQRKKVIDSMYFVVAGFPSEASKAELQRLISVEFQEEQDNYQQVWPSALSLCFLCANCFVESVRSKSTPLGEFRFRWITFGKNAVGFKRRI